MKMKLALDALIPREDFDVKDESGLSVGRNKMTISVPELEYDSFFFSAIKKPDFQRETNEWEPDKVYELVKSFLDGELVPAVILWKSISNYIFVIDGSHRLSALAAWINDDYGDGLISRQYFDNSIPEEQIQAASYARELINREIGSYKKLKDASRGGKNINESLVAKAKSLGSLALQVQWVEGNSKKAEESFFKINQQASPINQTEIKLIRSRTKPSGLATRAINRSGTGHNYWSDFSEEVQTEIYSIASEINDILFKPEFKTPIKTLDLPIGGRVFSDQGLSLILETINITNGLNGKNIKTPADDITGEITIKYLKNCRKVLSRITTTRPGSLGLHPVVYFYSMRGIHKIASYYAVLEFVNYLEINKRFNDFIKVRKQFEDIMIKYEFLVQQIVRKYRQSTNGYSHIKNYYVEIMDKLIEGNDDDHAIDLIVKSKDFSYLGKEISDKDEVLSKRFSDGRKSNVFIINSLKSAARCAICGGLLHSNSITIDHITRKVEGGLGSVDNGQLAHPYCNSTYKN
jgi:hypothetical protein